MRSPRRMLAGCTPFAGARAARTPLYYYTRGRRGRRPRKPLPAERARGRGVFHSNGMRRWRKQSASEGIGQCLQMLKALTANVDKICLYVENCGEFADIFVTLQYNN